METQNNNLQSNVSYILTKSILVLLYIIISIVIGSIILYQTDINYIHDLCSSSNIWHYVLISTILLIHNVCNTKPLFFIGIYLLMIGWGIYELFNVGCINELYSENIFKITFIHFIANIYYVLYQSKIYYDKTITECCNIEQSTDKINLLSV
jgi:hypothetical protein